MAELEDCSINHDTTSRPRGPGKLDTNIDEVHHPRAYTSMSVERLQIDVIIQKRSLEHVQEISNLTCAQGDLIEQAT